MTGQDRDLTFDLESLVAVFGEPTSLSNPEALDYWFTYERSDGATVTLSLSGYERTAAVVVRVTDALAIGPVRIENCDEVKVLEIARRTIELVSREPQARCFLSLDGETVLDVKVG